ncbi:MAG: RnfABCDGE type electron transport complex subunit A [Bacilli bacterium]|jgi:electron transport complex protein RnfA
MEIFTIAITAILINNIVLSKFLGICPFLGVSKKSSSALGMGLAVIFVIVTSSIVTFGIYHLILTPLEIQYMDLITFIVVIAALVQFVEMVMKKFLPSLYKALGIYLPLITTNCAVLGVALENIKYDYTFGQMLVYSISVPVGYLLVIMLFSAIREKLDSAPVPNAFKGNAIALIVAGLMALAFSGFAGLV